MSRKKNPTVLKLMIKVIKEEFKHFYILYLLVSFVNNKKYLSMNVLIQEELFMYSRNFGKTTNSKGKVIYSKALPFLFRKDECYCWSDKVIL